MKDIYGRIVYPGDKFYLGNYVVIDLQRSPRRTNYERYFADIGTIEEIVESFATMKCEACGVECPFFNWPVDFGGVSNEFDDCEEFVLWLDKVAVV